MFAKKLILLLLILLINIQFCYSINPNIIDSVSIDSLVNTVKDLSGEQIIIIDGHNAFINNRKYDSDGNRITENYLLDLGRKFEYRTYINTYNDTCNNIIWESDGTLYSDSIVIIGAHFDTYNIHDFYRLSPGADDNASGCAAIIEIARLLKNYKPLLKMKFIFWDEEEVGLYGSEYYSRNAKINTEKIKLYINLDMIGWDKDNEGKIRIRYPYINKSSIYANSARKICLDFIPGLNPVMETNNLKNMYFSDSYYFWEYGYSAIALSDVHGFEDLTHTQNDLISLFNLDYYLNNTKLALALVMNFAYNIETNVSENNINDKLSLYPNPASEYLVISGYDGEAEIINALGLSLWHGAIKSGQRIDVSHLPIGLYFIQIGSYSEKFMVLR